LTAWPGHSRFWKLPWHLQLSEQPENRTEKNSWFFMIVHINWLLILFMFGYSLEY
jgi:hypothetical protein